MLPRYDNPDTWSQANTSIGRWRVNRRLGCTIDGEFVRVDAFGILTEFLG